MKLRLLLLFLFIPVVAYIAALFISAKVDEELVSAVRANPEFALEDTSRLTALNFCRALSVTEDLDADIYDFCAGVERVHLMKLISVWSAVAAVGLIFLLSLSGRIARRRRRALLLLFKPLLYATIAMLILLMAIHSGLAIYSLYLLETTYIGRLHIGIILALGVGALMGIAALTRALEVALSPVKTVAQGNSVTREQQPRLWKFVEELAQEMGVAPPDAIVLGLAPNFYVTEARVRCLSGELRGRTLYLSVLLSRIFSLGELRAVLGHELAHFKGLDTQFSRRFYPIYRGASAGLVGLESRLASDGESGSAADLVLMPAIAMLTYFLGIFSEAEREIGRERELVADAESAKLSPPVNLAAALVKVHALSQLWSGIRQKMKEALSEGVALRNAGVFFSSLAENVTEKPGMMSMWIDDGPPHPTDSHPGLSLRLDALQLSFDEVEPQARIVAPSESAISLLEDAEAVEKELTAIEQLLMIQTGEAAVPSEDGSQRHEQFADMITEEEK